jgi:protoporphyrinogen oxidase
MTAPENPVDVVIIGAGPAGLGAALALQEKAVVLERRSDAGGLCQTVSLDGAVFDLGGHSFHTPHPEIRELVFGALPMDEQPRQAWCFLDGEWIPYPFQKNFTALRNPAVIEDCQSGLEGIDAGAVSKNLDEHIEHRYGAGIARHFLRPYNEKLWGKDLTRLSSDWTGERMAGARTSPTGSPEIFVPQGGARTPLQADTRVAYPAQGGYGEIFRALAGRVPRLRFDESVGGIDVRHRSLTTSRGERIYWKNLVSTLPLPRLLDLLPDVPAPVRHSVDRLVALPLILVLLALKSRLDTPMQRVYCPGAETPGHKIVLNHNSSRFLRALPRHGILVEISKTHGDGRATTGEAGEAHATHAELSERVVRDLERMRLLRDRGEVTNTRIIEVPYGYPVPTHERASIVASARDWLAGHGIHTVGRFGEWAYINSDEALYRGLRIGAALAHEV